MGSVESLTNVKKIVENINEPVVVVVSALGGITDRLSLQWRAMTITATSSTLWWTVTTA